MRVRLTRIGNDKTVVFAMEEVSKYLHKINPRLYIDEFVCDSYEEYAREPADAILIGVGIGTETGFDDRIRIDVKEGAGVISGPNARSVLFSAYRFLYELGCRFPTPEDDGDVIPAYDLQKPDINVSVDEKPSYRHRGVVLEGCLDYMQAFRMINWMPKLALNSYFIQYLYPRQYFARVYDHYGDKLTVNDSLRLQKRLVEEIKKRDMLYHAVGHTWQSVPFGLDGTYGGNTSVPEESRKYLALVGGKRDIMFNNPLETEVCYSDPEVRRIIINAVVKYCKEHPEVDYLHFWQSDGSNNCCECEKCRDKRAADIYVPLLKEIDKALTEEGLPTKIVFLCYSNLTWAPVVERFDKTDRFVFMATIAHSYSKPMTAYEREPVIPPYVLNRNKIPKNNESSIAMMKEWQKVFDGDSFLFDYNQIWDHYKDPGYMKCAERIAGDARLLRKLNLNGLHSCQVTQAGLPTWLPTYTHGLTLWNDQRDFGEIADEYFKAAFGDTWEKAKAWCGEMSDRFDPPYLRHEKPEVSEEASRRYAELASYIREKTPEIASLGARSGAWKKLEYNAVLNALLADGLSARAAGDAGKAGEYADKIVNTAMGLYEETMGCFDTLIYTSVVRMILESEKPTFSTVVETER